jgi:hypothetical protein
LDGLFLGLFLVVSKEEDLQLSVLNGEEDDGIQEEQEQEQGHSYFEKDH